MDEPFGLDEVNAIDRQIAQVQSVQREIAVLYPLLLASSAGVYWEGEAAAEYLALVRDVHHEATVADSHAQYIEDDLRAQRAAIIQEVGG